MDKTNLILVTEYCRQTQIEDSFVFSLHDFGIIEYTIVETQPYIETDTVADIERMFRLHRELGINLEGIDALNNLLKKMREVEQQLEDVKKRLRLYE